MSAAPACKARVLHETLCCLKVAQGCATCHDQLEKAQDHRHFGRIGVGGEPCVLEDIGSVVQHTGLACDLLEQHQAAAHQQGPHVAPPKQGPQAPCRSETLG